jgi:hypothetical protein
VPPPKSQTSSAVKEEVKKVGRGGRARAGDCGPPQGRAGLGVAVPVGLPPPKAVAFRFSKLQGLI